MVAGAWRQKKFVEKLVKLGEDDNQRNCRDGSVKKLNRRQKEYLLLFFAARSRKTWSPVSKTRPPA
jgi:hypothetical protein